MKAAGQRLGIYNNISIKIYRIKKYIHILKTYIYIYMYKNITIYIYKNRYVYINI